MANTKIVVYGYDAVSQTYVPIAVDLSGFINVHITAVDPAVRFPVDGRFPNNVDAVNALNNGNAFALFTNSVPYLFDGLGSYDRGRSNRAANMALETQEFAQMVANPGEWAITSAPAANTVASTTKGAGAGSERHVLRSINASISAVAEIAAPLTVVVRDGAAGVGTIIWQEKLMQVVGRSDRVSLSGLNIIGSRNTAMTVEFTSAPGATNFETISCTGYTTQ